MLVPGGKKLPLGGTQVTVGTGSQLSRAVTRKLTFVPPDLHASAIPIVVAGETMGLLVFVFADVEPHDDDNGRLLTAVSAAMGFALLRDRLAQELREAAGAPG